MKKTKTVSSLPMPQLLEAQAKHGPVACGECSAPMRLRNSRYGLFWGCTRYPQCRGTHGAHPDGRPLGMPADKSTKQARMKAHEVFDALWKDGDMSRAEAYAWLRETLGLSEEECHISRFDIAACKRVVLAVQNDFPAVTPSR